MKTLSELQIIAEGKYPKYKTITDYRHNDGSLMSAKDWGFYCHIMTNEQLSEWTPLYDGCNVQKAYIQGCLDTQEESGFDIEFYRNGLKEIVRAYEISSEASISGLKMRDMALQMLTTFKDKPV